MSKFVKKVNWFFIIYFSIISTIFLLISKSFGYEVSLLQTFYPIILVGSFAVFTSLCVIVEKIVKKISIFLNGLTYTNNIAKMHNTIGR